jgi:adenylate cyclase class 2
VTETEIKLRWNSTPQEAQALIEGRGYAVSSPRTLESDQLFDLPTADLRQSDRILRLRKTITPEGTTRAMVTYKGPATRDGYKSREEIEFDVSDPATFTLVLHRLGYQPVFRYEKFRTQLKIAGEPGIITIDETPIGVYLEIEGPHDWINGTAERLGLSKMQFLTVSYASLYRDYRAQHPAAPADMTFDLDGPTPLEQNDLRRPKSY